MTLDEAIDKLNLNKSWKMPLEDVQVIKRVANELSLKNFQIQWRETGAIFIYDDKDCLHIHRTMLVANRSFTGSRNRGPEPYPKWPHFRALSRWVDRSSSNK